MRGRKPAPTDLKVLSGTRPDRVGGAQPARNAGRPVPPGYLTDDAKAQWERLCDALDEKGVLEWSHGFGLEIYCSAYDRLRLARESLQREGIHLVTTRRGKDDDQDDTVVIKANPSAGIAAAAEAQMHRVLNDFGLTPASASRVHAQPAAPAEDKLAQLLARRKG